MPYVKINTMAPTRGGSSKHGYNATHPNQPELPTLAIADMLIQLTSHQQVIAAELEQIDVDIKWLEEANKRYADVRIRPSPSAGGGPAAAGSSVTAPQQPSPSSSPAASTPTSPRRSKNTTSNNANGGSIIFAPTGAPIVNAPPNAVAVACFKKQLRDLKLLKEERQAALKEIRQHLALYQLHAPSGMRLLGKVKRSMGTSTE